MKLLPKFVLPALLLLSTSLTSLQAAVIYSDAVEDNGTWTTIYGGFYPTGAALAGLTPTAGSTYLTAFTSGLLTRGFHDAELGSLVVAEGTYTVTFDIGTNNNFDFADRITPIIGLTGNLSSSANINEDNGTRLLDTLDGTNVNLVSSTTYPSATGWETWTLTYTVDSGASVIGQDLGFWAKFYTGTGTAANEGYAFDNFSVSYVPEASSALLGLLGTVVLLRRRR